MANYQNLLDSIAAVIRTNGNQEITGAVLQSTLQSMVSVMGANATYGGVAHPTDQPGTPDGPVVYVASEAGIYTNFGAISIETDELAMLLWNPTTGTWSKESLVYIADIQEIYDAKQDALDAIAAAIAGINIDFETISGDEVQLNNGNGTNIFPTTKAAYIPFVDANGTSDVDKMLKDVSGTMLEATITPFPTGTNKIWNVYSKPVANYAYKFNGFVRRLYIYSSEYGNIECGTLDITSTPYVWEKLTDKISVQTGWNTIELNEPIAVTTTKLFAIQQLSYQSRKLFTYLASTAEGGSYYADDYHNNVFWLYHLDYTTTDDGEIQTTARLTDLTEKLYGEGASVVAPNKVAPNAGYTKNNWIYQFSEVHNGDHIKVVTNSGWLTMVASVDLRDNSVVTKYQDYATGTFEMDWEDGDNLVLRTYTKKSDNGNISRAQLDANLSVEVTRPAQTGDIEKAKKNISILFIGNSLTQDAVSYVPFLLQTLAPEIDFKFYVWYYGGKTIAEHLAFFRNDTPAKIFSVAENTIRWLNYDDSKTMTEILATYKFDMICFQEYFNNMSTYDDADKQALLDMIDWIQDNYDGAFDAVTLFQQPKRATADATYALTRSSIEWMLNNAPIDSVIPSGIATYKALSTTLDNLGDQGHLSPDGIHSQEGLPCLLQAYVTTMWIYNRLGIAKGIVNNKHYVTTDNYEQIRVPGPNIGTGIVVGTEADNRLAQRVAVLALNEGRRMDCEESA